MRLESYGLLSSLSSQLVLEALHVKGGTSLPTPSSLDDNTTSLNVAGMDAISKEMATLGFHESHVREACRALAAVDRMNSNAVLGPMSVFNSMQFSSFFLICFYLI